MSEIKLKPCPFCGSEAVLNDNVGVRGSSHKEDWQSKPGYVIMSDWKFEKLDFEIQCRKCRIYCSTGLFETANEAIAKWNTRFVE